MRYRRRDRAVMDPGLLAIAERGAALLDRRLSRRLRPARQTLYGAMLRLPPALRLAAHADHADHRAKVGQVVPDHGD